MNMWTLILLLASETLTHCIVFLKLLILFPLYSLFFSTFFFKSEKCNVKITEVSGFKVPCVGSSGYGHSQTNGAITVQWIMHSLMSCGNYSVRVLATADGF